MTQKGFVPSPRELGSSNHGLARDKSSAKHVRKDRRLRLVVLENPRFERLVSRSDKNISGSTAIWPWTRCKHGITVLAFVEIQKWAESGEPPARVGIVRGTSQREMQFTGISGHRSHALSAQH